MIGLIKRLFARAAPVVAVAQPADADNFALLHAASFRRGWTTEEFERLLVGRDVVAHRAMVGRMLAGFILSRLVVDEAEILSVAVASAQRGRGLASRLLDLHLRRLAGLGVRTVFLEVDQDNIAARRLYHRAGFAEVGRRDRYYPGPDGASAALVLRRELA
jgi:ribosomal-protein-alanine N-acetyltransferase